MAETLSNLRTRLARRLSLGTLSTALTSVLTESINGAIARLALSSEDLAINQLHFIGETWGNLTATASNAAQGDTSFTFSGETFLSKNVFHGDILEIASKRYLVTTVTNTALGVGAPLGLAISGAEATIYRRTIKLPYAGIVSGVAILGSGNSIDHQLTAWRRSAVHAPVSSGTPEGFSVAYDKSNDATYLNIFPATTGLSRFLVKMTEVPAALSADSDSLDWPEKHIDGMLELAREQMLRFMANQSEVILADAGKGRLHALQSFREASSTDMFKSF